MNCEKHDFHDPGYQCKDCTIDDLRARIKGLELRVTTEVEAYLALCDKSDRYRKALEKIAAGDFHEDGDTAREALKR